MIISLSRVGSALKIQRITENDTVFKKVKNYNHALCQTTLSSTPLNHSPIPRDWPQLKFFSLLSRLNQQILIFIKHLKYFLEKPIIISRK